MEAVPRETVDIWIVHPKLNPRLLIPSLLRYDHNTISDKVTQVNQQEKGKLDFKTSVCL
jgi:hypothetical protein